MENMQKSIKKGQSTTADAESTNDHQEMETEALETAGSSEAEEKEAGQQDPEDVDSMIIELNEKAMEEEEEAGGQQKFSELEMRIMNELKQLTPAAMIAEIERLERKLHEYSQRAARDIIRYKHLDVFGRNRRRSGK